ncbi:protein kinase [Aciduricibacillus chroicocephali]|uniref:Protein kinase n=2 Tax=Aciduricibacillus chroicocephali TaxID=3054939 RepID=A0ABY9KYN2_9BACI|nr:protein kinase [Bacillaceae bacterium 44XB]
MAYLCRDLNASEYRVVKQLRPSKLKENEMFIREIDLLKKLDHPGIPKLHDHFLHEQAAIYVMDYIEGENAEEKIFVSDSTFTENEALLLLSSLVDIIEFLHEQHVYHLDLRIPNIMLKNGNTYLIDFGLAVDAASEPETVQKEMRKQDYYDMGDVLLYLLYTTFNSKQKKALPWTEELSLSGETVHMLKKLLGLIQPYENADELRKDLLAAIKATSN